MGALRLAVLNLAETWVHPGRLRADEPQSPSVLGRPLAFGGSLGFMWDDFVDPLLVLALFGVALALALLRWQWAMRNARFFTVADGELFRSGALRPDRLKRKVQRHGIRTVIDLRSARPAVDREREALAEIGVRHVHLPSKQVPRQDTIEAVLALLDQPENRPALVHCNHGVRRAAQFEAIYRMEYQRWSNERALSLLRWRSAFLSFGSGSRSSRFLRAYVPRRERMPETP